MTERLQYKVDWILPGKETVIGKEIIEVNRGIGQILTLVQQDIDGEPMVVRVDQTILEGMPAPKKRGKRGHR